MKLELFDKINFHDSEIKGYKRDGTNIAILIEDGWLQKTYFKIKLKNVKLEVMNNKHELICYTLDRFYDIFKNNAENLIYGADYDVYKDNKYYLKLYIIWPSNVEEKNKNTIDEYYFDDFSVGLCNDYNDTGHLYIKFIMDDFDVIEI